MLGGGPVGCELAQAWSTLGHQGHPGRGRRATCCPRGALRRRAGRRGAARVHGVDVRTGVLAERVRSGDGGVAVELDDGGAVEAEELLVAVGRKPPHRRRSASSRSGSSPASAASWRPTSGCGSAAASWLYAVGDVNGRALFTHMGKYQAWVAAENVLGREVEAIAEGIGSPRVTFTDPQVAAVGKTLAPGRGGGHRRPRGRRPHRRHRRRQLPGQGHRRHLAHRRRRGARRRSSARPSPASRRPTSSTPRRSRSSERCPSIASPRRRRLPDAQRDLAEAAGGLRGSERAQTVERRFRSSRTSSGKPGDLVEIVDRAEAAKALAVGEQAGRLGDREVLLRGAARR